MARTILTCPRDLNNLADTLRATNRLAEAKPLMRRMVLIFLAFQRATGHPHPHRDQAINNHTHLLTELGHGEAAINAAIQSAHRDAVPGSTARGLQPKNPQVLWPSGPPALWNPILLPSP